MRIAAMYMGSNRDFRAWLKAGMPENVISLEMYKNKKAAKKAAVRRIFSPSIA